MKKTILSAAAAVAVLMLTAGSAAAQTATAAKAPADPAQVRAEIDKAVETLRKDVRAGKSDILGKTMELDSDQAAKFWPIYKQYEAEAKLLGDERLGIIQDLADHFDSLDDAKAKALLDRQVALEDKKLALMKKYKDEMLKALPAKTVARFFQVDSRLNKLVELTVASEIPLVY
jgi:PIN domain nuclease of toxin-antitoxin system